MLCRDIENPVLDDAQSHHIFRVLRLREGDSLAVVNGEGAWSIAILQGTNLRLVRGIAVEEAPPSLTIAFALPKGENTNLVIQKLTEIGLMHILPIVTQHTVVRWDAAKAQARVARMRSIAREAAMQSRRTWLPTVASPRRFDSLEPEMRQLAHWGGAPIDKSVRCLAIGPEGGWSDDELASASRVIDLGATVLRAETAAIAAGVLMRAHAYSSAAFPKQNQ